MYGSLDWVSIGSDNGLSQIRHQAIIGTNAGILLIWALGYKVWDEITYPFLNVNGCTVEV